jgi:hypothetical protein
MVFLGVVLPALAASFEVATGFCREAFFDPLPNVWSCFVFALIPLGNGMVLYGLSHPSKKDLPRLLLANGIAIGASIYFSLTFLPLAPLSLLGSLLLIGLFGLAPFFALACAWRLRSRLLEMRSNFGFSSQTRLIAIGGTAGFLALFPIGFSVFATDVALNMMASPSFEQRERGVYWLEHYANPWVLAHLAAGKRVGYVAWNWNSMSNRQNSSVTHEAVYRITGRTVRDLDPRARRTGFSDWNPWSIRVPNVPERSVGLSLSESVIDGWADGEGMVGYLEWTMVVQNHSSWNREAVSTIQLPKGATVSRLTLWVNGEEREAAFSAKAKVTEAYQRVVRRKRDPVLITTEGLDRIQVRCFPVMRSGNMRFRIGISMPLELESSTEAILPLPFFVDRNFDIPSRTRHHIWIESRGDLKFPGKNVSFDLTNEGKHRFQGWIRGANLPSFANAIRVSRKDISTFWNTWDESALPVVGNLQYLEPKHKPTVVVLDGSWGMKSRWDDVIDLLGHATNIKTIFLAGKEVEEFEFDTPNDRDRSIKSLQRYKPDRGRDNVPALRDAWSTAIGIDGGQIVWIHAQQPYALSAGATLHRPFNLSDGPDLIDVPLQVGPNVLLDGLPLLSNIHSVPLLGQGDATFWDRVALIGKLPFALEQGPLRKSGHETSKHLTRLWAVQKIQRGLADGMDWDDLVPIAERYRVVSLVSGAVVLETNNQYVQAGLGVPEKLPQTATPALVLLLIGSLFLITGLLVRYRTRP